MDDDDSGQAALLQRVAEAMRRLEEKVEGVDGRLAGIDEHVEQLGRRIATMETRVEQVHGLIQQLRQDVAQNHAEQLLKLDGLLDQVLVARK
jgi:phage shock protein A